MPTITFMGAGSTVFAKSVLGDSLCTPALQESHLALYDIDPVRLKESKRMMTVLNKNINKGRAKITAHCGKAQRREALRDADYVVNAIQVGGYEPSTVIDFEIPKKYGLKQTIADTIGIGGIFRTLRTVPVMLEFAREMEKVCPNAMMLNYTNPQGSLVTAMAEATGINIVGLCHSVQCCAQGLLQNVGMWEDVKKLQWNIAGINHQSWLLSVTDDGKDLYPEIKKRAAKLVREARKKGAEKNWDMVRLEMMRHFGHYITESSEHSSEYMPYWIKHRYPELIEEFNIPIDEYLRRCEIQIDWWKKQSKDIVKNPNLKHNRSLEYASHIMEAMETDVPTRIGGNVMNTGLITNLPSEVAVEVPCMVDRNGVQGCYVGDLPPQCAALTRTYANVHILAARAALSGKKEHVYHAAMLDPHTAAELSLDDIVKMCNDLFKAHGPKMLPQFKI
jgi:alpha-galactosidase